MDLYAFGFIVSAFANFFLLEASPNNWAVIVRGWFAVVAPTMAWLMISSFSALAFLGLAEVLRRIPSNVWRLSALPLLFALTELLRSYLFAVMAYAPHGSMSPNFNWGSLAVPASGTPLVYASRIVGFFGLTALVVGINVALYLALKKRQFIAGSLFITATVALSVIGKATIPTPSAAVQNLKIITKHFDEQENAADWTKADWPPQGTDLLVLPEYSGLLENKDYKAILQRLSKNGLAITTMRNGRSPGGTNRLIFINREGSIVEQQDKTFLIPTGETLPYSLQATFTLIKKQRSIEEFRYLQQITPGDKHEAPFEYNGIYYGALACSGVSALNEYSRLTDEGADILINSASLSFLKTNSRYHVYADNMARFQSVSTGKLLVQASRSGNSYILQPK